METIEEAAETYAHYYPTDPDKFAILEIDAFKAGANWQKEQNAKIREALRQEFEEWHNNLPKGSPIYTEEEVKNLIVCYKDANLAKGGTNNILTLEWFENNKKK
jgi:hypothetical protein